MQWIDDLEVDAWNTVIEELVWYLCNGRTPTAISRQRLPDRGIEFRFNDVAPVFPPVEEEALETHWKEAIAIIARSPQLDALRFRCNV